MAHAAVPSPTSAARRSVAVIGAGAAGLAAVRELLREGHSVVGFEQAPGPGGVWVYEEGATDSDPLGAQSSRRRVHGSMYRDLRTNLPREIMGFLDYPFTPALMGAASKDPRRFCGHEEVLSYLELFAQQHRLHQHFRFNTRVVSATPLLGDGERGGPGPRWRLRAAALGADGEPAGPGHPEELEFDALVVANGHYSEPNLPDVARGAAAAAWPGVALHSHNYRAPDAFAGQTVVVVGASNSGEDVCREVGEVAERVVLSARSWKNPAWGSDPRPFGPRTNISRRGMVTALRPDGGVEFATGPPLESADAIIYCTGYRYYFPFLEHHAATAHLSGQQWVPGLYRQLFVPELGASLALVGLPWKVVPFPLFQLQSQLVARLLSGRASLPPAAELAAAAAAEHQALLDAGTPLQHAHMLDAGQWPYKQWLAEAAGADVASPAPWRAAMYASTGANRRSHPEDYRDRWDDEESAAQAEAELSRLAQQLTAAGAAA